MKQHQFLLELQERLYADSSGELRASLIRQLSAMRDSLLAKRRQLHQPGMYRDLQAALMATEGALKTLNTLRIQRRE